jgi:hypothetical protein
MFIEHNPVCMQVKAYRIFTGSPFIENAWKLREAAGLLGPGAPQNQQAD